MAKDIHEPPQAQDKGGAALRGTQAPGRARDTAGQGLDPRSQEAIGRSLRAHYDDLVRAPVPNKFLEMLDRLEATEQSKSQGGDHGSQ